MLTGICIYIIKYFTTAVRTKETVGIALKTCCSDDVMGHTAQTQFAAALVLFTLRPAGYTVNILQIESASKAHPLDNPLKFRALSHWTHTG